MSKQDVTYSRTAEDLERKYNLGQIAQGGTGGDSGKISQALQELSDCKATISNMLRKISEIESQLGEGGNIVYLTQSEYDALPDSKLTDDVEYRITDTGIGETKASNVSYDNSNSGLEAINTQMAIDEVSKGLVAVELWKNPDATVQFIQQTITLSDDIENYNFYEVEYNLACTSSSNRAIRFKTSKTYRTNRALLNVAYNKNYNRVVLAPSGKSMTIEGCRFFNDDGSTSLNNEVLIPVRVSAYIYN